MLALRALRRLLQLHAELPQLLLLLLLLLLRRLLRLHAGLPLRPRSADGGGASLVLLECSE